MRLPLVLVALASFAAGGRVTAQCTPAVSKLVTDQKYDEARNDVDAAIRRNEHDDAALHCMGMIAMAQDNSKDAAGWFEKAVDANPKSALHHLWLANSLGDQASHTSRMKLPFLARRIKSEFDQASTLDPTSIDARHGLILFYSQAPGMMGGSADKAKEQAREIGKLNPMRGHLEMAALIERDKDVSGAEREYASAITSAPDSSAGYNGLAGFYRRQKRYSEAVATFERLLKARPDAVNAHLNIAASLNQSGQGLERAEREIREWLAAPPRDVTPGTMSAAHVVLGNTYEKQGKKDAARAEYQQALTLNPRNADAKRALEGLR